MSSKELEQKAEVAFALEHRIKGYVGAMMRTGWQLAEDLYRFQEMGAWALLDYDNLGQWLAQPEVNISRTTFFRLTRSYRALVLDHGVKPEQLAELDPSKVAEVLPALKRGDVALDKALADVKALGARDLRTEYGSSKDSSGSEDPGASQDPGPGLSGAHNGSQEPSRTEAARQADQVHEQRGRQRCPACGQFIREPEPMNGMCWLAQFDQGPDDCDGRLDPHHLVPQQQIKNAVNGPHLQPALADPRNLVPACRYHHERWHNRRFTIPASAVPAATWEFAMEYALEPSLLRDYERDHA